MIVFDAVSRRCQRFGDEHDLPVSRRIRSAKCLHEARARLAIDFAPSLVDAARMRHNDPKTGLRFDSSLCDLVDDVFRREHTIVHHRLRRDVSAELVEAITDHPREIDQADGLDLSGCGALDDVRAQRDGALARRIILRFGSVMIAPACWGICTLLGNGTETS